MIKYNGQVGMEWQNINTHSRTALIKQNMKE
jgi:hypothetical protein